MRTGVGIGENWACRRDVQAAVDEVAERIDLILRVLLGRSVHLLEFLNQKARGACFGRVEVADFCLELTGSLSVWWGMWRLHAQALT